MMFSRTLQLLFLSLIFFTSCSPKITEKTITHRYTNLEFQPKELKKELREGLVATIIPVDAKELDQITFKASSQDGNYEKEFASVIQQAIEENNKLSRSQRDATLELKGKVISAIEEYIQRGIITKEVGALFKLRIWQGKSIGVDGSELMSLSSYSGGTSVFNPFKIGGNYLSLFKVVFSNNSDEIQNVNLANFQFIAGEELLRPYGPDFFEKAYEEDTERLKNAYRFSMPESLRITPGQTISKYLAISAIDDSKENVMVQFIDGEEFSNFKFSTESNNFEKVHKLIQYSIKDRNEISSSYVFYVVDYGIGGQFALEEDKLFIDKDEQSKPFSIYGFSSSANGEEFSYGENKGIKASDYPDRVIPVKINELD